MLGFRRYRIFLLVAFLTAVTIYHLVSVQEWGTADYRPPPSIPLELEKINIHGETGPQPDEDYDEYVRPPSANPPPTEAASDREHNTGSASELVSSPDDGTDVSLTSSAEAEKTSTPDSSVSEGRPSFEDEFKENERGSFASENEKHDHKLHWKKPQTHFPIPEEDIIKLPTGRIRPLPRIQARFPTEPPEIRKERIGKLAVIKQSFKHAWDGYKKYAMPHDELAPLSAGYADPFMGWGATLVDSLDTLWILGMKDDFEEAVREVAKIDFTTSDREEIPLFETVIRYLGGLIAAHDLTDGHYQVLLKKAEELAEILMGAFDTPNHMPIPYFRWAPSSTSKPHRSSDNIVMAELGSLALEFTRLAQLTKKDKYYDAIARVTNELENWQMHTAMPGLWPLRLDASGCKRREKHDSKHELGGIVLEKPLQFSEQLPANHELFEGEEPAVYTPHKEETFGKRDMNIDDMTAAMKKSPTKQDGKKPDLDQDCDPQGLADSPNADSQTFAIGAQADSTYEYFPKMYALLGGRVEQYRTMYTAAMKTTRKQLIFRPMIQDEDRDILFASSHKLFLNKDSGTEVKKEREITYEVTHLSCFVGGMFGLGAKVFGIKSDMSFAEQLTDGCVWAYEAMPAGVMSEAGEVVPCERSEDCIWSWTRWHKWLDRNEEERIRAVEKWNQDQEEIYKHARKEISKPKSTEQSPSPKQTIAPDSVEMSRYEKRQMTSNDDFDPDDAQVKRISHSDNEANANVPEQQNDLSDIIQDSKQEDSIAPTRTTPELVAEDDSDEIDKVKLTFKPKKPLSHEAYVTARILEEKLPPSFIQIFDGRYGLRPEAIESVFYMYRLTGDETWRAKGWKMFEAIQRATLTEFGNAAVNDVRSGLGRNMDKMESFWLAETLKYFYLLFSEPDVISLDDYVLNTEAHPFKLPK